MSCESSWSGRQHFDEVFVRQIVSKMVRWTQTTNLNDDVNAEMIQMYKSNCCVKPLWYIRANWGQANPNQPQLGTESLRSEAGWSPSWSLSPSPPSTAESELLVTFLACAELLFHGRFVANFDLAQGCSCTDPAPSGLCLLLSMLCSLLAPPVLSLFFQLVFSIVLLLCLSAFPEEQHQTWTCLCTQVFQRTAEDLQDVWQVFLLLIELPRIINSLSAQDNNPCSACDPAEPSDRSLFQTAFWQLVSVLYLCTLLLPKWHHSAFFTSEMAPVFIDLSKLSKVCNTALPHVFAATLHRFNPGRFNKHAVRSLMQAINKILNGSYEQLSNHSVCPLHFTASHWKLLSACRFQPDLCQDSSQGTLHLGMARGTMPGASGVWDLLFLPYAQSLIHWRAKLDWVSLFCSWGIHVDKDSSPC